MLRFEKNSSVGRNDCIKYKFKLVQKKTHLRPSYDSIFFQLKVICNRKIVRNCSLFF